MARVLRDPYQFASLPPELLDLSPAAAAPPKTRQRAKAAEAKEEPADE